MPLRKPSAKSPAAPRAKKPAATRASAPKRAKRITAASRTQKSVTTAAKKANSTPAKRKSSDAIASKAYRRAEREAREVVKNPRQAASLARKATNKASVHSSDLGNALDELETLLRVIRAYAKGDYRELPTKTMIAAVAAVVYFVSPADLIPDPIPVIGYVDDVAVLFFVVKAISADLEKFRRWESDRGGGPGGGAGGRVRKKSPPKRPAGSRGLNPPAAKQ
jgi:uncharacterized membrane protein YkvA (DUF1232 family)